MFGTAQIYVTNLELIVINHIRGNILSLVGRLFKGTHPEILDDVSESQVFAQHLVDLVDQAGVHLAHLLRGHL